jgi:DNA modification methylase
MFNRSYEPIFLYRRVGSTKKISIDGATWGAESHDLDCNIDAIPQENFNGAGAKVHPAQKPLGVMLWLVGGLTEPGDLVVDPFAGSGTTGIACVRLRRRFRGVERSLAYLQIAERRIAAYGRPRDGLSTSQD